LGALYRLAAVGIALVFRVTKFPNIAHGEFLMFGGYVIFWLFKLFNIDTLLSLPLTIIFLFLIGIVLYQLLFVHMVKLSEGNK
jgi:branched-chain amino acid transport system permease protein